MNFHGGNIYTYGNGVLDFSSNINPLGAPKGFRNIMAESMESFCRYPDISYNSTVQSVCAYLKMEESNIILGNGAVDIIYKAVAACKCRNVVICAPTFSEYRRAAQVAGIAYTEVSAFDFENAVFDLNLLKEQITEESLVIVCNPNNPTGGAIAAQELESLMQWITQKKGFLLIDEAFMEFTLEEKKYSMLEQIQKWDTILVIRAATKFFGLPGIRLGYGVTSNHAWKEAIERRQEPWYLNTAAVLAAEVIFQDNAFISKTCNWMKEERLEMEELLPEVEGMRVFPTKANFFMLEILYDDENDYSLRDGLLKENILIRTSDGFKGLDDKFVRVAIKDRRSNLKLITALKKYMGGTNYFE